MHSGHYLSQQGSVLACTNLALEMRTPQNLMLDVLNTVVLIKSYLSLRVSQCASRASMRASIS